MSSLQPFDRLRRFSSAARPGLRAIILMACALLAASGCSDAPLGPEQEIPTTSDAGTTLRWNLVARQFVIAEGTTPPRAARAYANLSVAQYIAARAAVAPDVGIAGAFGETPPSQRAAIASASAAVIRFLFPSLAPVADQELASQLAALEDSLESREAIAAGRALGEEVADAITRRATDDGADATWSGTAPTGAFVWFGSHPQEPHWGSVETWLVESGRALRAPPPPDPESAAFLAALDEVRTIAEHRTPEQLEDVFFWADGPRSPTPAGHWNEIAAGLIRSYALSEEDAAAAFARMNMAVMDAVIGCWDSKFTYWLIRPYQADPEIRTPIGQPPHPSYPSGHACMSGAASVVLASVFPNEAARLAAMEQAACDSRVYAGIHYRFDSEAGQRLGATAAELAIALHLPALARSLVQ